MNLRKKSVRSTVGILFISIFSTVLYAEEFGPFYPTNPTAPIDIQKGPTPLFSLTSSEAKEIASEFGGILYLALHSYSYDDWPGKQMSDCKKGVSEAWGYQCELITGNADTLYSFYYDPTRRGYTLQQIDVHFEVADPEVLKELKRPVRTVLGEAVSDFKANSSDKDWNGTGKALKWKTTTDLAYLYMDANEPAANGEGLVRFQWRRSPLYDLYSPLARSSGKSTSD